MGSVRAVAAAHISKGAVRGGLVCKRRPCVGRLPIHVLRVGLADRWWPARSLTFVRPWRRSRHRLRLAERPYRGSRWL
ncbi:hypothetical protein X945_5912 [Burkholderia pseudomallei ABCPW 107]|nr:hypothetical protein X945_5912 [Burkholderia pseudomallei ABCPW 107]